MQALFLSMVGATVVGIGLWRCVDLLFKRRNCWTVSLSLPRSLTASEHNKQIDAFIEELKSKKK
jgi:hypothetical protein